MTTLATLRRAWGQLQWDGWLSNPVLLVFLAWTIPSVLYIEGFNAQGRRVEWLVISAASALVVVALLLLVRRLHPRGPRPAAVVAGYVAAGALRGALIVPMSRTWGLESAVQPAARVLQSAVWAGVLMACASIVIRRWTEHRSLIAQLQKRQDELLALQGNLGASIDATRADLARQARAELEPTVLRLRGQLDALAEPGVDGTDDAITSFRLAINEVVRPLTRSLSEGDAPELVTSTATSAGAPPEPARAPLAAIVQPAISAVLLVVLALLTSLTAPVATRPASAPVRVLLLALALFALLWIARQAVRRVRPPTVAVVVIALLVGSLTIAVASGFAALGVLALLIPDLATFPGLAVALMLVSMWATGFAGLWQELAQRAEASLRHTVEELESLTAVLRRELWRERRRLAMAVHGPVQSSLVATSVALAQPGFDRAQIPALATALDQAMAHIDRSAGPPPPLDAAARDLTALWAGSVAVEVGWAAPARELIDADPALADAVIEVLREGVSNAVRHGAADRVSAWIDLPWPEALEITLDDDGDGPPSASTPGLGSRMLDEVAADWALVRTQQGTRLTVHLSVRPV